MDLDESSLLKLAEVHGKASKNEMAYGTAGFRGDASIMDHIFFRMGLLATLRSKLVQAAIGVMVTASHNPEQDNGVKLIDPKGEMLSQDWEVHASRLGNISNDDLLRIIKKVIEEEHVDMSQPATVFLGRDTRVSSLSLSRSVMDGVNALNGDCKDFGLLTTPQLHFIVAGYNSGQCDINEDRYYKHFSEAFKSIVKDVSVNSPVTVDCANGVGAPKLRRLCEWLGENAIDIVVHNEGVGSGRLNEQCGADYVKVQQAAPFGLKMEPYCRYASFDGDADRLVYYTLDSDCNFILLDGDKVAALFAVYIKGLLDKCGLDLNVGVVQTAYANGNSTRYLTQQLRVAVSCVRTGVKHLHVAAHTFDVGIYFEANGHGTVIYKRAAIESIRKLASSANHKENEQQYAAELLDFLEIINPTVGDALSDMLAVEAILHRKQWTVRDWSQIYHELPNRQLKVKVADRNVITTEDAERRVTSPPELQYDIDRLVAQFPMARSFVRPSGTEDAVRVYAESDTQEHADDLARLVSHAVYDRAGGNGPRPS